MKTNDLQSKMMRKAILLAREGKQSEDGGPFGAVITKGEHVIASCYNLVGKENDCTEHAELRATQLACNHLKSKSLKGCVLYTSCEPCMMCLGAAYWAEFDYIYYGASAEDAKNYGFLYSDMYYSSDQQKRHNEFKMIQMCQKLAIKVWE